MKKKIGCVIMASGRGVRFGSNKLMADLYGKTLLEHVLELTGDSLFDRRVVVTRSEEVRDFCLKQHVEVIFHELPNRNDTVRLGIEVMKEMDGCMFCPCDQPLLRKTSLVNMMEQLGTGKRMIRLAYGEKQGTPVLFDKYYFEELTQLPQKSGGSYLIKKYPDDVTLVFAENEGELFDVDTQEDYVCILNSFLL